MTGRRLILVLAVSVSVCFRCRSEHSLLEMEKPRAGERILIIAPHIDDEALGAAGYAYDAVRSGSFVAVAYLTAGDCNPIPAMIDDRRLVLQPRDFLQEGRDRIAEGLEAMDQLGVLRPNVYVLGYPDRGLKEMVGDPAAIIRSRSTGATSVPYADAMSPNAAYTLSNLRRDVQRVLDQTRPTTVIMPVRFDLHPDHASTPAVVRPLLSGSVRVLSYLVHARQFPHPFFYSAEDALEPPQRFAHLAWMTYPLSRATEEKKLAVLRMYRTQRRDPHLYLLTEAFVRRNELFVADQ